MVEFFHRDNNDIILMNRRNDMRKSFTTKTLLTVALLALLAGSLSARGGQPSGGGSANSGTSAASSAPTLSFANYEGWYAAVSLADNLPLWQEIEKATGTNIEWQVAADYDTAMGPVIATGSNLPDIMFVPDSMSAYQLGQDGLIIPLEDLIAQNAPNLKAYMDANPTYKAFYTQPDGHIYSFGASSLSVNDLVITQALMIRQDWLDKLGLKAPVTIDDWHTVLSAFKTRDPNGNGKADEIPLSLYSFNDTGLGYLAAFAPAFGLPAAFGDFWYDASGKVFHVKSSPQYRNLLETLSRWNTEGLIDLELGRSEANQNAQFATGLVGATASLTSYQTQMNGYTASIPGASWTLAPPPAPAAGSKLEITKRTSFYGNWSITKNCKDPVAAIKFYDYLFSAKGQIDNLWGIEGQTYTMVNGKPQYNDFALKNPNGLSVYEVVRSLGAYTILYLDTAEVYEQINSSNPTAINFEKSFINSRVEPFPTVTLTNDQQRVMDTVWTDLNTYIEESLGSFWTGQTALNDASWNAYLNQINSLGMPQIIALKQSILDKTR
jgi:putative aldouronate transport system substrate-binding protein